MNEVSPGLRLLKARWGFMKWLRSPTQQVAEGKQEEIQQKGQAEKKELQNKIDEMEEKEQELQAKIEALQADNDFTNERLTALQGKLVDKEIGFIWFLFSLSVKYLFLGLFFTVRLEHLQEKTLKECSSLGRCHLPYRCSHWTFVCSHPLPLTSFISNIW